MGLFSSSNTFDPNKDIPDLSGRVYVVTGGSAGIGFGIVAHLLQHNAAKIIILSNKMQHAEEAMEELKEFGDVARVEWVHCDLSDLKQTDGAVKTLAKEEQRIDALILNAGLGVGENWETVDGIDSHMQVNHFSQMHLFLTLLPNLQATHNARVVVMSSELHRPVGSSTKFESLAEINSDKGPMPLYNRTKLAQVLFVRAVKRRMDKGKLGFHGEKGNVGVLYINATHPGGVVTDQQDQAVEAYGTKGKLGVMAVKPFMKDPVKEGCRSALYAATSDEIVEKNIIGEYIVPDKKITSTSDKSQDDQLGENLWKLSLDILREKLGPEAQYQIDVQ
ncbi:hypothetical protein MMC25_006273 [Agyrium rufum]|nr:hypothetical protein [Agyrium rufum]